MAAITDIDVSDYIDDDEDVYVDTNPNAKFDLKVHGNGRHVLKNVRSDYKVSEIIELIHTEIFPEDKKQIGLISDGHFLQPHETLAKHGFPKPTLRSNYVTMHFQTRGGADRNTTENDNDVKMGDTQLSPNTEFPSHMTYSEVSQLEQNDAIDHRDYQGRFCAATIKQKFGTSLKITYDEYDNKYNKWIDYSKTKAIQCFVTRGAVSERTPHRMTDTKKGDTVHINPNPCINPMRRGGHGGWNKDIFEWTREDITAWIKSLGSEMAKYVGWLNNVWDGYALISLQKHDLPSLMPESEASFIWSKIQEIRDYFKVTEQGLRCQKRKSMTGLIGLCNRGDNTCFMNTAIQLVFQTPTFHRHLIDQSNKLKLCVINSRRYKKDNMLPHFVNLYNKSESHQYGHCKPTQIFSRLCQIDSKYKKKEQQDAAIAMSEILRDIDDDLNRDGEHQPKSKPIAVHQMLNADQEDPFIQHVLQKHNPNHTLIRSAMDGVQRIIQTCLDCNWQRIEYETFRSLQLPLISNTMRIDVEIWMETKCEIVSFHIENYCKITTLKYLIYKEVEQHESFDTQQESFDMDSSNIVIGSFIVNREGTHEWISIDFDLNDDDSLCKSLPARIFATFKPHQNKRLLHVYNTEIDSENTVQFINSRFVEIDLDSTWNTERLSAALSIQDDTYLILHAMQSDLLSRSDISEFEIDHTTDVIISLSVSKSVDFPAFGRDELSIHCVNDIILHCKNNDIRCRTMRNGFVPNVAALHWIERVSKNKLQAFQSAVSRDQYINTSVATFQHISEVASTQYKHIQQIQTDLCQSMKDKWSGNSLHRETFTTINIIEGCLSEYQKQRVLDDHCSQMFCKKCKEFKHVFTEQTSIVYSPLHLSFMIERRNKNEPPLNDKLNHLVTYPHGDEVLQLQNGDKYTLYGVGCHLSRTTLQTGHYISYVKSCYNGQWYLMNDRDVTPVGKNRLSETHSASANILMYTKQHENAENI
eukprot:1130556_1